MKFTAVLPGPFHAAAFRVEMEDTIRSMGFGMLVDFEKTTSTWDHKPTFEIDSTSNERFIDVHVFCDALRDGDRVKGTGKIRKGVMSVGSNTPPNLVYYFLNYGTAVRYAHMSANFRPKTQVRVLGSFPGQGWLWKVDLNKPLSGIEAREWDKVIAEKYGAILPSQLTAALNRAVRGSGHAFK